VLLWVRCVSQCVAVCCSVLQCVAVCCSVLQCVALGEMRLSSSRLGTRAASRDIETGR